MARFIIVLAALAVVGLTGSLALRAPRPVADFVVAIDTLRTIDPARVSWQDELQAVGALYEGLTRLDPSTLSPAPGVAAEWTLSDDGLRFEFRLRPEARWSSGQRVVAGDFRLAWLRVLDPRTEAQYAGLLFGIAGARAYYESRLNAAQGDDLPAERVGIEAPEDGRLLVTLAQPCPYFLELTSFATLAPVHPASVERDDPADGPARRWARRVWTRAENLICNGPFVLREWSFKDRLLLERSPSYWDRDAIELNTIELQICPDPTVALLSYETGGVDLVRTLEPNVSSALRRQAELGRRPDFHCGDRFATFFFRVNCSRPPLDDVELRRALALAIDRSALCESVLANGETPAYGYVPPAAAPLMTRAGADGREVRYEPVAGLGAGLSQSQREEQARACLARSRFVEQIATRPIEIAVAPDPPQQRRIAEAVQVMWERVLGIRVSLQLLERKVLNQRIATLEYDLARSDWYGDYLDPSTFLDMFTSGNGQNRTGWSCAAYDRLIAAAQVEADHARRYALLHQAEALLCVDELPILPIYFKRGGFLLRPEFTGLRDNVLDVFPIHFVRRAAR